MDKDSVPIAGVTVMLKGTYVGVTTDISGKFQMTIPEQKEVFLLFSFVGMETREVKVTVSPPCLPRSAMDLNIPKW